MNKKYNTIIAPSIFAADFFDISKSLEMYKLSNVDYIHYDVMDNHFVPNISFGSKIISDIISRTNIPSDVHLMIELNKRSLNDFLKLPVNHITLHYESTNNDLTEYIKMIKESGKSVGVSLKPSTPISVLNNYLDKIDLVLIMTVEPGFSGQKFMSELIGKISDLKKILPENVILQVDGGIDRNNYIKVVEAGADFLVIGSAFANDRDPMDWVNQIHSL